MKVTLANTLTMGDTEPELAVSCNKGSLSVEILGQ